MKYPAVRMIFQWTLLGVSKREITDRLNLLGVATPGQKEKRKIARVPLEETKWNGGTVRKILENPTYTGDIVTGKLNNCASHSRYFSDELDAQIFYSKKEHMFTSGTICAKI